MSKYEVWLATHAAGISGNARVLLAHYIQHSWFDAAHRPKGSNAPRGVSYWSQHKLAEVLSLGASTVYRANKDLEDAGYITITNRYREGDKGSGGRTSNAIRVHLEAIEAHQIEGTNDAASYPQPPVNMNDNPPFKMNSKGEAYQSNRPITPSQNDRKPPFKMTDHKDSNKKIVRRKKTADGSERPLDQPHALPAATAAERLEAAAGIVTGLAHDRNPSDLPRLQSALATLYGWEAAQGLTLEAIPARCITMGKARKWVQGFDSLQLNTAAGEPSPDADSSTSRRHQPASICTDPASRSGRPALHPGDALPAAPWAENSTDTTTGEIAGQSHSDKPASAWNELVPSLGRPEQDPGQGSPSPVAAAPSTTEETAGDILCVADGGQGHHNRPAAAHPTATAAPEAPAHQPTGDTYQPIEPIPGQIDVYEALDEIALHPAA